MTEEISTPIDGLKIKLQKAVWDERGVLCELTPEGMEDSFLKAGLRNIHTATTFKKHVMRIGHYHRKNSKVVYTLNGTALWIFSDFRKDSKTFGNTFEMVASLENVDLKTDAPTYVTKSGKIAQMLVPPGVFHAFWSLTDSPVTILVLASEPYKKEDNIYPTLTNVPKIKSIVSKYGLTV